MVNSTYNISLIDLNALANNKVKKGIEHVISHTGNQVFKIYALPAAIVVLAGIAIYSIFNTLKDGADIFKLVGGLASLGIGAAGAIGGPVLSTAIKATTGLTPIISDPIGSTIGYGATAAEKTKGAVSFLNPFD